MAEEQLYLGGELDLFALAKNWKSYIRREISDYLDGDVLEVGAGIGATTAALHDGSVRRWVCLEPDQRLATRLKARLAPCAIRSTARVVVGSLRTFSERARFDTVLYIDVLEHIREDRAQVEAAAQLVRRGGHIVILSPAHHWLYSEFDRSIGHVRRYAKTELRTMMPAGWREIKLHYLDSLGVFLSLTNALGLRQSLPTEPQIRMWDSLIVPASRILDRLLFGAIGKSVLAVWRRESAS